MKYKVFFLDEEVANFETLEEAKDYIYETLNNDKDLVLLDFTIYKQVF